MNIAVIDDESDLRETIIFALNKEGYKTKGYRNGLEAWIDFKQKLPDLVLLDVSMPEMDGLELCRKLRTLSETLPILFLSSKDEEIDRILGLEMGGDDYMCKPFSLRELIVKIKVLFRRYSARNREEKESSIIRHGNLKLDIDKFLAFWKDNIINLTVTEFNLLKFIAESPGIVRTRDSFIKYIYPDGIYVSERTIDTHIKRLRKKIEILDENFEEIETVYGLGYRYREVPS
jgi:two-component system, OmpR family, response regulator ChvI